MIRVTDPAFSVSLLRPMWQLSTRRVGWLPVTLAIALLSACGRSQETVLPSPQPAATPVVTAASPITSPAVPPSPSPSLKPSAAPATVPSPQSEAAPAAMPKSSQDRPSVMAAAPLPAGDRLNPTYRATQRMAGFSADGNHYLYLESSRDTGAGIPTARLQLVDLAANTCVDQGCIKTHYGEADSGLSQETAEDGLLQKTWKLRQELQLTPPTAGSVLPIVARSRASDGTETATVRVNDSQTMQLRLRQKQIRSTMQGGQADKDQAAMQLEVTDNGQRKMLDSLDNYRPWTLEYSIREVRQSPDGKAIAVLITATRPSFEGSLGTTLVQGFVR